MKMIYNQGHNILRLLDMIANSPLTTSETKRDYSNKHGIYELLYELPNDLRFWISGSYEVSVKS